MEKIIVTLGDRSYPIIISSGIFSSLSSLWPLTNGNHVMIVTNDCLAPLYLDLMIQQLQKIGMKTDFIILSDGENHKSITSLNQIFTALLTTYHSRDTTIIAFGGGVIGDISGFAASSYQRGVRFIQIPTTLLSQVDASVGGKTAINHPLGKNMIGAFYQPSSVMIDLHFLHTLPKREFSSGLAEVIKYGIIFDTIFFSWLENNIELLLMLDYKTLSYCVRRCCEIKANIIAIDEHDQNQRMLLNLGHTYGHAIEAYMGYGNWLHGEAISVGMIIAMQTALNLYQFSNIEFKRVKTLLKRAHLPVVGPKNMKPEDYLLYMLRDKKNTSGKIRLIIPIRIGLAEIRSDIDHNMIIQSIKECS